MNSNEMISVLKTKGSFPTSDDLFSPDDLLSLFNFQMKVDIVPLVLKLNEEYFLQPKEYSISLGSTYRIPTRAVGAKLRDLKVIDSSGNFTKLDRLFEEDRGSGKSGYYMLRNSIELTDNFTSGSLRVTYFAAPSTIVLTTACAQVQTIDTVNKQVVVTSTPSTFANGVVVDFVQNNNPYDLLGMDYPISSVSGTTLTFSDLPSGLDVGDWVCLAKQAPVPMIPDELHPVLIQSTLVTCLSSKKDKALEVEAQALAQYKLDAVNMLDPRVGNDSMKLRSGPLLNFFAMRRF